jgi:protein SCO1/2
MTGVISLALTVALCQSPGPASRLADIRHAPDFQLIDQDGKLVRLSELREEVLLVGFIFTTCNGTCPATTHQMARVEEELQRRGLLQRGKVRLLSITLDPKRDTPEALRNYMHLYDIDGKSWSFLTGPPGRVARVLADWGMWARPAANGQLDHPSRIFLLDHRRNVREIYNLGFLRVPWVVEDVEDLLK